MNTRQLSTTPHSDALLIIAALKSLHESTGIIGRLLGGVNASVVLQVAGKSLQYLCDVKLKIDRYLILDELKARSTLGRSTLLICNPLTHAMAVRCRELDIQFIDTAGNAYVKDGAGVMINVAGRKLEKDALIAAEEMTITPLALRMMFAFLAKPSMLNAPYRDISRSVQVSIGAIGKVFDTLETRGFIGTGHSGNRIIVSPEPMLSEWATGYLGRLRPKLKKFRFTCDRPSEVGLAWTPEMRQSAWSGEVAAEHITQHLNPATFTIYLDMENAPDALPAMVKRLRLRADPKGPIEVVQAFWNMDDFCESFPTVPLHLVYADLLGTNDSRNLIVAKDIYRETIRRVQNPRR